METLLLNYILIQIQHASISLHESFSLTKNGVAGVHGNLVFRRIADQSLGVGEGYVTRCSPITLIIGNDFDFSVLKDTHAGIRGAQVNSNCRCFRHCYPPLLQMISQYNQTLKSQNDT